MLKIFIYFVPFLLTQVLSELRMLYGFVGEGFISPSNLDSLNEDLFGERWDEPTELTPSGMRQMHIAGHRDFIDYGELLSKQYNPLETYQDIKEMLHIHLKVKLDTEISIKNYLAQLHYLTIIIQLM